MESGKVEKWKKIKVEKSKKRKVEKDQSVKKPRSLKVSPEVHRRLKKVAWENDMTITRVAELMLDSGLKKVGI